MRNGLLILSAVCLTVCCLAGCTPSEPAVDTVTTTEVTTTVATDTSEETEATVTPNDGTTEDTTATTGKTDGTTKKTTTATVKTDGTAQKTTTTTVKTDGTTQKTTVTTTGTESTQTTVTTTTTESTVTTVCKHRHTQAATCTEEKVCLDCGRRLAAPRGHKYVDNVCTRCGEKSPDYTERVEVLGVTLDEEEIELAVGDTWVLNPTVKPTNATDTGVTWSTSNAAVATVGSDGTVTGVSAGDAVITVTSKNGKTDTCKVIVQDVVLSMQDKVSGGLNWSYNFKVDYGKSWNTLTVTEVQSLYARTGDNSGTLTLNFRGEVNYSGAGSSEPSVATVGWRLYDAADTPVAEGTVSTTERIGIGHSLVGMTATVSDIAPGRYRLELFSTYK